MLRLSLVLLLFCTNMMAVTVLISTQSINFEQKIDKSMFKVSNIQQLNKACNPLKLSQIQNGEYITTHYINKNTIICEKDVKQYKDNFVIFNFGGFEIEKEGKIIYENDEFIRIKKQDGSFEKIYKDGRLK